MTERRKNAYRAFMLFVVIVMVVTAKLEGPHHPLVAWLFWILALVNFALFLLSYL